MAGGLLCQAERIKIYPMKEALFYTKEEGQKTACSLCPHYCRIAEGNSGICGVRENQGGVLYSLVYGKVAAANPDPIEKKPLFHFLPGSRSYSIATVGCNFRCDFCQNYGISQLPREKHLIEGEEMTPQEIVAAAQHSGCQSISYTYTEPTIYFEYAYDTAVLAAAAGLKNVFVTNGFITPEPLKQIAPILNAANIDLKSMKDETYRQVCGGSLQPVLNALRLYRELNIWIEVTTLVIPGLNDSKQELSDIARFIRDELGAQVPWHLSAFYPTYKMTDRPPTPPEELMRAQLIGIESGLKYVYCGNVSVPGLEDTHCPKCRLGLISRSGFGVIKNALVDGRCYNCGEAIDGIWE